MDVGLLFENACAYVPQPNLHSNPSELESLFESLLELPPAIDIPAAIAKLVINLLELEEHSTI